MKQTSKRVLIGLVAVVIAVLAIALWLAFQGTEPANQPTSNSAEHVATSQSDSSSKAAMNTHYALESIETKVVAALSATVDQIHRIGPLSWNIDEAFLVGSQGTTELWGTCGQCCIANTLNLVTGSAYTEADIVAFTLEQGLCEPETGGMSLDHMVDAYDKLLPNDSMGVFCSDYDYAPTIDGLAARLEYGLILNVSVYGEMMREGGHIGEGEIPGTHWIVLHSVDREPDGSVAGFGIIDSASSITYLTAQELSDIYYGHDGTTITDPTCIQIFGRATRTKTLIESS